MGWLSRIGVAGAIGVTFLGGCASGVREEPVTRADAFMLQRGGLVVEYVSGLDRFTWFGPMEGPNLLHVVGLEREIAADEAYTFFGGCYTWVAPQNGWLDADGDPREWPPDPAMDVGPGLVTGQGVTWFETTTPVGRLGLQEVKRFELLDGSNAQLTYTLENLGEETIQAAAWVNVAVAPDSVVAVRWDEGVTQVWGWNDETVERFRSLLDPVEGTGWAIVDLSRANWTGGGKVWLSGPAEIAVWRQGTWLHRRVLGDVDGDALRTIGEGPVALYIQPGDDWIVEAELYGKVAQIGSFRSAKTVEHWTLIRGEGGDVSVLDE